MNWFVTSHLDVLREYWCKWRQNLFWVLTSKLFVITGACTNLVRVLFILRRWRRTWFLATTQKLRQLARDERSSKVFLITDREAKIKQNIPIGMDWRRRWLEREFDEKIVPSPTNQQHSSFRMSSILSRFQCIARNLHLGPPDIHISS